MKKFGFFALLLVVVFLFVVGHTVLAQDEAATDVPDPNTPLLEEDIPLWMSYFSDSTGCRFAEAFNGVVNERGMALPHGLAFYQANPSAAVIINGAEIPWREVITILPPSTMAMPAFPPGSIWVLQSDDGSLPSLGCFASQLQYMSWDKVAIMSRYNARTGEGAWADLFVPDSNYHNVVLEVGSLLPVWAP